MSLNVRAMPAEIFGAASTSKTLPDLRRMEAGMAHHATTLVNISKSANLARHTYL
jgi:hypothetical protein